MSMKDDLPDDPDVLKEEVMRLQEELEIKDRELVESEELVLEMKQKLDDTSRNLVNSGESMSDELSEVFDVLDSMRARMEDFENEYVGDDSDYGGVDISPLEDLNKDDDE